ncbi:N-acetylgalactosamine kinase isoform X2 [Cricetulus griseus]|uniref:N-acetylgalactosamine kinase isoform X5 n=1 Tax=Cricetulus griseus TaxID=10029 RepID=A0A9J7G8S8_CRIGR|nr:N-acetylgalactosamine kinase isoform X5 [Cricetulus griseus]XP_035293478.1 N-acetylgalactosamine kinase isoform X2 [Cricetulus griseus]
MAAEEPTKRVQVAEHPRLLKLKEMFNSKFGSTPKFYVRAPGRVNIIGEHIDYCGYSVLPMAVEQDMLIAVEPVKTHTLQLANTNPLYPDFSTSANNIYIDKTKPLWHNYFLCGFKGIQEHFGLSKLTGMNCLVDGNIPPGSGLSSSSALVCCAGLVTLTVLGMSLSKVELAEICAKSERYIGTEGGGMDQSISFLAEEGTAKLIEFSPLRATDVKLPSGAVFVIANSCVEMNKAATSHFNVRVMECRLAAKVLAKHKGLQWDKVLRLEEVQTKLGVSLEEMLLVTEDALHAEPYSREEICRCLGISLEELRTQILSPNTQDAPWKLVSGLILNEEQGLQNEYMGYRCWASSLGLWTVDRTLQVSGNCVQPPVRGGRGQHTKEPRLLHSGKYTRISWNKIFKKGKTGLLEVKESSWKVLWTMRKGGKGGLCLVMFKGHLYCYSVTYRLWVMGAKA